MRYITLTTILFPVCIVLLLLSRETTTVVRASDPFAFVAPPSISVETYQAVYCQRRHGRQSDACPYAPQMYQLLVDAGIDPVIELAFAAKETEFGITGPGRAPQHNIHNLVCNRWDEGTCEGPYHYRFSTYPDYLAAIRSWIKLLLSRGIYVDAGNDTFRKVLPIYAPPSENDTSLYIAQVEGWVSRWRGDAERGSGTGSRPVFVPVNPDPPWWMVYEGVISPTWGRGHGYDGYDDTTLSKAQEQAQNSQVIPATTASEADALAALPGTAAFPQNTLIVDDRSSGFSASQENWSIEPCGMSNSHMATRSTTTQSQSTSRASWRAPVRAAGRYEVLAYIPDCGETPATRSAHYVVSHDEGMHEVVVDQEAHTGEWASLGVYLFGSRYTPVVEISDLTADEQRSVRVDVLVWIPQPDTPQSDASGILAVPVSETQQIPDPWSWAMTISHCSNQDYLALPIHMLCQWEWWAERSGMIYDIAASQQAIWLILQQESDRMSQYRVPLPPPPTEDPITTVPVATSTSTPIPPIAPMRVLPPMPVPTSIPVMPTTTTNLVIPN